MSGGAAGRGALVEAIDIEVNYGGRAVLRGATLSVAPREVVALMGPSGSGKSTLMRVIAGMERAKQGELRWSEGPVGIAVIPQLPIFARTRTARENLAFVGIGRGEARREAEQAADDVLGLVGLSDRADLPSRLLSGGEMQRLAVARAHLVDGALVLADEPTASLDGTNAVLVAQLLRTLAERGRGVLVATHDHRLVESFDRIVALRDGVVDDGSPEP